MSARSSSTDAALAAWLSLGGAPSAAAGVAQLCGLAEQAGWIFAGGRGQGAAGPLLRFADAARVFELNEAAVRTLSARAAAGRPIDWAALALPEGAATAALRPPEEP